MGNTLGVIYARDADMRVESFFGDADERFGSRVAPLFDITGNGRPEIRTLSYADEDFIDLLGGEQITHIFDGETGEFLFAFVTDPDEFDPWQPFDGDVNGDGYVGQDDIDIIMANMGMEGPGVTRFDGDLNGDGVVDALDLAIAMDQFGLYQFEVEWDGEGTPRVFSPAGEEQTVFLLIDPSDTDPNDPPPIDCFGNPHGACCCPCEGHPCTCAGCGSGGGGGTDTGDPCIDEGPCSANCSTAPCNPACGGDPCLPECEGSGFECGSGCGIDPCSPSCDTSQCNPDCGGNPCVPECEGTGFECDPSCNPECKPECGGDPCSEECQEPCFCEPGVLVEDDEVCCDDVGEDDEPPQLCVGLERTVCAPGCPPEEECEDDGEPCEPDSWVWSQVWGVEFPSGYEGKCVSVRFMSAGSYTLTATSECCSASTSVDVDCCIYIMMDVNRDGEIDLDVEGPDNVDKNTWSYGPDGTGAIIRYNCDRDSCTDETDGCSCDAGCAAAGNCCPTDAADEVINGEDDLDDLEHMQIYLPQGIPDDWSLILLAAPHTRIFDGLEQDATAVISPTGSMYHIIPASDTSAVMDFGVEATRYPGSGFSGLVGLQLGLRNENGGFACIDKPIFARVAPWMMPSHLDDVEEVYVTDAVGARQFWPPGCTPCEPGCAPCDADCGPSDPDCTPCDPGCDPCDADCSEHPAGSANPFPVRLADALAGTGVALTVIPSTDMWPQDQYEIGFHSAPGDGDERWQSVLLNSPRYRPGPSELSEYAAHHLHGPDYGIHGVGETAWHELMEGTNGWHNTHDSFGNLEAFPPFGDWTSGVIYHGHEQTDGRTWNPADWVGWTYPGETVNGMKSELVEFLAEQQVQNPEEVDTSWLAVAHVDEFISVQATGPDTFRVILASPQMGIDILAGLAAAPGGFTFEHGQLWTPVQIRTAAELLEAPPASPGVTLQDFNENLQILINDRRAEMAAIGITDFVEVPAYFISRDWSPGMDGALSATGPAQSMLPDMVNMLNVNGTLIVPNPNPHLAVAADPFKQAFENAVGATVRWIDCMEYHYGVGEIHCGTNVRRTPRPAIRQWWLVEP